MGPSDGYTPICRAGGVAKCCILNVALKLFLGWHTVWLAVSNHCK